MPEAILGQVAGAAVGGLLGGGDGPSQTQQMQLDPRMQDILYGNYQGGGIIGDILNLYKSQAQSGGLNPLQAAGLESQRQVLTDPSYMQGPNAMRSLGLNMMGGGVAANPFTSGQGMPAWQPRPMGMPMGGGMPGGMTGQVPSFRPQVGGPGTFNPNMANMPGASTPIMAKPPAPAPTSVLPSVDDLMKQWQDKLAQQAMWSTSNTVN